MFLKLSRTTLPVLLLAAALPVSFAAAQDLTIMTSGAFSAPTDHLTPGYQAESGNHVTIVHGASMGDTPTAIPARLLHHEPGDVVILARAALDALVKQGLVVDGSQVDLVRSRIGMAVKAGAPVPDISTVEAFKQVLLNAKSIAYSDSASGVYIETKMFKNLGIEAQVAPKSKKIPGDPVGGFVAKGDYEIGFQQMSELKPIPGITIVGPIPDGVQLVTYFSAGIVTSSQHKEEAAAFIRYMHSKAVCPTIVADALEPTACVPEKR